MRVFTLILIVSLLLSCKKTGMNYVKGTVYEEASGEPVKGATVYLYEDHYKKDGRYLDSVLTDEKGEYHINFSKNTGKKYYVSSKCKEYYPSPTHFDKELEHGRNAINFEITPCGYVLFRFIKNTNSPNFIMGMIDGDRFMMFESPSPKTPKFPANQYVPFDISSSGPMAVRGNRNIEIRWSLLAYDSTVFFYSLPSFNEMPNSYTFYAKKGDTLKYTITFN
jgi:hypothetical protein